MSNQRLGDYVFYWNPDRMTLPERKKFVGRVQTFSGSALFQWDALLEGTEVVLEWDWMPDYMYTLLRLKYLDTANTFEWNPQNRGESYNVVVKDLNGELTETGLYEFPYRLNVKMTLEIRSAASTTTTSSSSTTSSTLSTTSTMSTISTTSSSSTTISTTSSTSSTMSTTSSTMSTTSSTASTTSSSSSTMSTTSTTA